MQAFFCEQSTGKPLRDCNNARWTWFKYLIRETECGVFSSIFWTATAGVLMLSASETTEHLSINSEHSLLHKSLLLQSQSTCEIINLIPIQVTSTKMKLPTWLHEHYTTKTKCNVLWLTWENLHESHGV